MPLTAGTRLGPYEIVAPLGEGGMGEVYDARDTRLERHVAVKVLPGHLALDANMELLEGQTLQQRLTRGPLDVAQIVDVAIAIADALDAAHAHGLIHRDLKPANIFLTSRGVPKILDFGLAKGLADRFDVTRAAEDALTGLGTTVGTVAYMSPEQLRGETLDVRTDLFSLGLVLYEMATGQRAFLGPTTAVVSAAILGHEPAPPRLVRADLPPRLEETILKTLEKDRSLRCQTAAELRADLTRIKRQGGSDATRPAVSAADAPRAVASDAATAVVPRSVGVTAPRAAEPPTAAAPPAAATFISPRRVIAAVIVVVAVGAIWASGYFLGHETPQSTAPATPPSQPGAPPATPSPAQTTAATAPAADAGRAVTSPPSATPAAAGAAPIAPPPSPTAPPTTVTPPRAGVPPPVGARGGDDPAAGARGLPPQGPPIAMRDQMAGGRQPPPAGARGARGRGRGLGPPGNQLVASLRAAAPETYDLVFAANDPDSRDLAFQLRNALTAAGWTCASTTEIQEPQAVFGVFAAKPTPGVLALINWARRNGYDPDVRTVARLPHPRVVVGRQK